MLGEQAPVAVLVAGLQDKHRMVRLAAIRAMGRMGAHAPLEQFVIAMHDPDWEVREMVALVLGELGQNASRPLLLAALQDVNSQVQEAAASGLKKAEVAPRHPLPASQLSNVPIGVRSSFPAVTKHLWLICSRQVAIMTKSVWVTSVLMLFMGGVVLLLSTSPFAHSLWLARAEWILTAAMATASAVGAAYLHGKENDAGYELALATPTSVRTVLLFRILLVIGYNALLGAVASVIITAIYGGSFWEMVQLWMGPVLFLSSLSLALSMVIGSLFAILASLVFEATQMLAFPIEKGLPTLQFAQNSAWQTTPVLLALALLLLVLALCFAPRQGRLLS